MIDLRLRIIDTEVLTRLDDLPNNVRLALRAKMEELISALREKVVENVSGRVLQARSGALARSIEGGVTTQGDLLIGHVGVAPTDPKVEAYAMAHEYGGKDYYEIVPVTARMLRFIASGGNVVFTSYVYHPPAQERSFLRLALVESEAEIMAGLGDALDTALAS